MRKTAILSISMILITTVLYFIFGWWGVLPAVFLLSMAFLLEIPIRKSNERYREEHKRLVDEAKRRDEGNYQCPQCGSVSTEIIAQGYKLVKDPISSSDSYVEDNYKMVYHIEIYCMDCEVITEI
jgi:hypothetical protein